MVEMKNLQDIFLNSQISSALTFPRTFDNKEEL